MVYLPIFAVITHVLAAGANTFSPTKGWLSATGLEVALLLVYRHCRQHFLRVPLFSIYHHTLSHQGWKPSKQHIIVHCISHENILSYCH